MSKSEQKIENQDSSSKMTKYQWRMILTAGIGFFTDAYDLFIIGVVTAILAPIWGLTHHEMAVLNCAALASAALGAVSFGILSDKFGRKRMYGTEVAILFVGAILSATAGNFTHLLLARILVGFGIGGDYPSSAVVASESANKNNRGFLVLLVFAMQAVGLIVGPLLASALLASHVSANITWRVLLGLGALPAASVFYLRRTIKESVYYKINKQQPNKLPVEVSSVVSDLAGVNKAIGFKKQSLISKKWLLCLLGTAGAWFCLDVALYGNGVSSVMILSSIDPHASILSHTLMSSLIFLIFAVPGYFLSAKYVDTIGRKRLQYLGFFMMTVCYLLIACIPQVISILPLFILTFGLSFFFVNFGPNATTFLIPSEIYPTSIRAKGHGISAAIAKVGAFLGALILPGVLASKGLYYTQGLMAVFTVIGIGLTVLIPEMKSISLAETEEIILDENSPIEAI